MHSGLFRGGLYPFARLAVPVFFILSGFFAFSKFDRIDDPKEKNQALIKTVLRYLKLYAFWFVVLSPITFFIRDYFRDGLLAGLSEILRAFLFTSTFQGSWYLMACVYGILIVFLLSKKLSNGVILAISVPFYIYATLVSKYSLYIPTVPALQEWVNLLNGPFSTPYGSVMISMIYITLGKMAANGDFDGLKKSTCCWAALICTGLLLAEFILHSGTEMFAAHVDCWLMLAPPALFLFLAFRKWDIHVPHGALFRKISTITYCHHMAVLYILEILFYKLGINDYNRILRFLGALLAAAVVSFIILKFQNVKRLRFLRYAY